MPKYKAPADTTEIFLTSGPLRTDTDGCITAPDDLPHHDVVALCAAGFTPVPERAEKPAKAAAPKEG